MKSVSATPEEIVAKEEEQRIDALSRDTEKLSEIVDIAMLGKVTEDFELFGHRFTMHALNERELIDATSRSHGYASIEAQNLSFRMNVVAASIDLVDGEPLYFRLSELDNGMDGKVAKVAEWYPAVIDGLFDKYRDIAQKSDELVRVEKKS